MAGSIQVLSICPSDLAYGFLVASKGRRFAVVLSSRHVELHFLQYSVIQTQVENVLPV